MTDIEQIRSDLAEVVRSVERLQSALDGISEQESAPDVPPGADTQPGLSLERRKLRAQKGVAVRLGRTEEAQRLDTEIRTARLADYIRRTVDAAPPLTDTQRRRLAALLSPAAEHQTKDSDQ